MTSCDHCAGRGWGLRLGYVRRCEECCFFRSDATARAVAERDLARFALRERPEPHVPPETGAMRCPWCNHLPTNVDIDTVDQDTCDEIRLQCPNPSCGKTFCPPEELDFKFEPEARASH